MHITLPRTARRRRGRWMGFAFAYVRHTGALARLFPATAAIDEVGRDGTMGISVASQPASQRAAAVCT